MCIIGKHGFRGDLIRLLLRIRITYCCLTLNVVDQTTLLGRPITEPNERLDEDAGDENPLMSNFQNVDWATISGSAINLVVIIAIVMEHRRLSVLKREVLQLSRDVKDLASADQRRFLRELKSATKENEK